MASFNLDLSKAVFNPFTYDQMIKPVAHYTDVYNEVLAGLDAYDAATSDYSDTIMRNPDSEEARIYQDWKKSLQESSDKIATEGLWGVDKTTMMAHKRNFNNNVAPIVKAAKTYEEMQKQARNARAKGQIVGRMPSLSELRRNPDASFSAWDADDIQKAGMTDAAAFGSQFNSLDYQNLNGWLMKVTQTKGITPQRAFAELENSNSPLAQQFARRMRGWGINEDNFTPEAALQASEMYKSGLFAGSQMQVSSNLQNRPDNPSTLTSLAIANLQRESAELEAMRRRMSNPIGVYDRNENGYVLKLTDANNKEVRAVTSKDGTNVDFKELDANGNWVKIDDDKVSKELQDEWYNRFNSFLTGGNDSKNMIVTRNGKQYQRINNGYYVDLETNELKTAEEIGLKDIQLDKSKPTDGSGVAIPKGKKLTNDVLEKSGYKPVLASVLHYKNDDGENVATWATGEEGDDIEGLYMLGDQQLARGFGKISYKFNPAEGAELMSQKETNEFLTGKGDFSGRDKAAGQQMFEELHNRNYTNVDIRDRIRVARIPRKNGNGYEYIAYENTNTVE